jgi:PEP-CTERM motif
MRTALIAAFVITALASHTGGTHAAVVFTENFNDGTVDPAITSPTPLAVDTSPAPVAERFLGRNDGTNNTDPTNRGLSNDAINLLVNSAPHTQGTLGFSLYLISTLDGDETFQLSEGTLGVLFRLNCENLTAGGSSCNAPTSVSPAVSGLTVTKVGDNQLGFTDTNGGAVDDSVWTIGLTFTQPFSVTQTQLTFSYFGLQELTDESWGLDNIVLSTNAETGAAPVPEPGTLSLVSVALIGAGRSVYRRLRRRG